MFYTKIISLLLLPAFFLTPKIVLGFDLGFSFKEKEPNRNYIYIVGSSTISPFMSAVSEEFSRNKYLKKIPTKTPHVESAGTVNGFISFCEGVGYEFPDLVSASRPIEKHEIEKCKENGVNDIVEIKIGYDGIIIGNFKGSKHIQLNKEQLFLALAEKVIDKKTKKLIYNPYDKWSDIDSSLPNENIVIYGPPLSSGTREVFSDLVMKDFCLKNSEFADVYQDLEQRKDQCGKIRHDGKFISSGENDNLIVQNLKNNPNSFGILGFNFLVINENIIQAADINKIYPTFNTISSKKYQLSRPLFVYFKKEHLALIPQMNDFIRELIDPETIGNKGYLTHNGLVPLTKSELKQIRKDILSQI